MFDFEDPQKRALLMMGLGLLGGAPGQRKNVGADFAHAGLLGMQGYDQASSAKTRKEEEKQQREMRSMQMEQARMSMEAARRQQQIQEQLRGAAGEAFRPGMEPQGPMPDGGALPPVPGGGGMPDFAQRAMAIDPMVGMQYLPKPREPKFHNVNGNLVQEPTEPGGEGRSVFTAPEKPQGPKKGDVREIKSGAKIYTYEFDGKDWKKIADTPQWKPDAPGGSGPEKAPQGYRWTPDGKGLEAIPGGPAEQKLDKTADATRNRQEGAVKQADIVLSKVRDAISNSGFTTTGALGSINSRLPGTDAKNLSRTLETIKANIGFSQLQAMREASPTGGALGNVAQQELSALQAVLGSLDQDQSQGQLLKNLYAIEKHFMGWKQAVQQAQQTQGGNNGFRYLGPEK